MFSAFCRSCGFLFISGQKGPPKRCPKCREPVATVIVAAVEVEELVTAWEGYAAESQFSEPESKSLCEKIPDAVRRYEKRRSKRTPEQITQYYRNKKGKRTRKEWKEAQIALLKNKRRLAGKPKNKGPFDNWE